MILDTVTKAPADLLDYDFDFSRWMPAEDRITGADAVLSDTTATIDHIDTSDSTARIWVGGGVAGESGTLTVTISTFQGRTKQVSATIRIRETS